MFNLDRSDVPDLLQTAVANFNPANPCAGLVPGAADQHADDLFDQNHRRHLAWIEIRVVRGHDKAYPVMPQRRACMGIRDHHHKGALRMCRLSSPDRSRGKRQLSHDDHNITGIKIGKLQPDRVRALQKACAAA